MSISSDQILLQQIDDFLGRTGMSPTRFGLDSTGEGGLVKSIRDGRSVTLRKSDAIAAFMAEYDAAADQSPGKTVENCPLDGEAA